MFTIITNSSNRLDAIYWLSLLVIKESRKQIKSKLQILTDVSSARPKMQNQNVATSAFHHEYVGKTSEEILQIGRVSAELDEYARRMIYQFCRILGQTQTANDSFFYERNLSKLNDFLCNSQNPYFLIAS